MAAGEQRLSSGVGCNTPLGGPTAPPADVGRVIRAAPAPAVDAFGSSPCQNGVDAITLHTFAALFGKRLGLRTPSPGYRNMLPRTDARSGGRGADKEAPPRSQSMLEALSTLDTLDTPSIILVNNPTRSNRKRQNQTIDTRC